MAPSEQGLGRNMERDMVPTRGINPSDTLIRQRKGMAILERTIGIGASQRTTDYRTPVSGEAGASSNKTCEG